MNFSLLLVVVLCVVDRAKSQGSKYSEIKDKGGNSNTNMKGNQYSPADSAIGFVAGFLDPPNEPEPVPTSTNRPDNFQQPSSCNRLSEKTIVVSLGKELCVCKSGFEGTPPNCTMGPKVTNTDKIASTLPPTENPKPVPTSTNRPENFQQPSSCNRLSEKTIIVSLGKELCVCKRGFEGTPPNCTMGPKVTNTDKIASTLPPTEKPKPVPTSTNRPENFQIPQKPFHCNIYSFSTESIIIANKEVCVCKEGFEGTPPNCIMGPQLWDACYNNNPCGYNSHCEMDAQYKRHCSCAIGYFGCPPNCKPGPKREAICKTCGPNSECVTNNYQRSRCKCATGFMGTPPNCTAGPTLLKSCDPYPCGPNSWCSQHNGKPVCSCLPGFRGESPNCKPEPEFWKICMGEENPCGGNEICEVENKGPKCLSCPKGLKGVKTYCLTFDEYKYSLYQ